MIFFSSDPDFKIFYENFSNPNLKIDLLVTESPKPQGRKMEVKPNPAHQFALENDISVKAFDQLDQESAKEIKKFIDTDKLGFIFAYGKMIPENIIDLFENGILNIHFSLLPEYPGASPIQQALLENKRETGYTVFEITKNLDQGKILVQERVAVDPNDTFDSLRLKIISVATRSLPEILERHLKSEITLHDMPEIKSKFTHRLAKEDGRIDEKDTAQSAYNKIRAYSRWPKTYFLIENKRFIVHEASLSGDSLVIKKIQPEGKKPMSAADFIRGNKELNGKILK